MDTPLLTTETYRLMHAQHIADEEVFAAFHSPLMQNSLTGLTVGIAHLPEKTVWAVYRHQSDGQVVIVHCHATYTRLIAASDE